MTPEREKTVFTMGVGESKGNLALLYMNYPFCQKTLPFLLFCCSEIPLKSVWLLR